MLARDERTNLGKQSSNGRLGAGITRRRFLGALTAGTALVALSGSLGCEPSARTRASAAPQGPGQARSFRSRPDLRPPAVKVNSNLPGTAPGHIFVSPKKGPGEEAPNQDAPLIVDSSGEPVWFHPLQDAESDAFTFEVQTYKGERVLTWWEGLHTDRKSTRLNSSHANISYAVFCLKKKKTLLSPDIHITPLSSIHA